MNLYELLGVGETATPEQIKKAHRQKVKECHPDKGGDPDIFSSIQRAYEILMDPLMRAEYDETGLLPENNPDNTCSAAYGLFIDLFIQTMEELLKNGTNPETVNIVRMIERKTEKCIKDCFDIIENCKTTIGIVNKLEKRFRNKDGEGEPFTTNIFRGMIERNEQTIAQQEANIRVAEYLTRLLSRVMFMENPYAYQTQSFSTNTWFRR